MKTILYTGYDAAYAPLAAITVPRMEQYAAKHGLDFKAYTEPLLDVPNGIYWTGVCGALKAFEDGYERVMYLDVDQLITSFEAVPDVATYGFHASRDWGEDAIEPWQFSACGFIAHKDCQKLFNKALSLEPEWRDKPFPEQGPLQWIYQQPIGMTECGMTVHPRKVFNCVPELIAPGNVPQKWEAGDFAAHLTMLDINHRIEIANWILDEIK